MNTTKTLYLNTETDRDILDWLEAQEGSVSQSIRRAIRYLLQGESRQEKMLARILKEIQDLREQGVQVSPPDVTGAGSEAAPLPPDIASGLKGLIRG